MGCADLSERIWLRPENEGERAERERHLLGCAACRARAAVSRRLDDLVRPVVLAEPPADLAARLGALVETAPVARPAPNGSKGRTSLWLLFLWLTPYGLAAGLTALALWVASLGVGPALEVLGDPAYAVRLLLASPAGALLDGLLDQLASAAVWLALVPLAWALQREPDRPPERRTVGAR